MAKDMKSKDVDSMIEVPKALIKAAQMAQSNLATAQAEFDEICESRRQAKDSLEEMQSIYNAASERVINYDPSGYAKGMPLADVANANGKTTDESWRLTTLASLGLKISIRKKLEDHEPSISTVGELTDWQSKKGDFWIKDIKGLDKAARDEIDNLMAAFWKDWNDKQKKLADVAK